MLAVGEHLLGEVSPGMMRMASIFAGGLAGTRQEMCGALAGGAMVVGCLHGRTRLGEDEQQARELVARFRERFEAEFGTTQCAPIREGHEVPNQSGWCAPVAERAVLILLQELRERAKGQH